MKQNSIRCTVQAGRKITRSAALCAMGACMAVLSGCNTLDSAGLQPEGDWETVPMPAPSSSTDNDLTVDPILDERPPIEGLKPAVKLSEATPAAYVQQDADGDKVPDDKDQCPDTDTDVPVNLDGCPIFGGVVEGINFREGSDTLTAEAVGVLAGIAKTLHEYPDMRIIIEAHTDNRGEAADNLQLSKRRAIAVARFLVGAGISGSRLKPQAYGESKPRTPNSTAEGRASNRRVEFSTLQ